MRLLLWLLALFALAAALAVAGRFNEGYVLLVLPPYRAELSLNFFFVLAIGGFMLAYLLLRLVVNAAEMPRRVREFRSGKRKEKGTAALRDALRLLFEGRYGHALKSAEQAVVAGEAPGLAALIGARAAHALRDDERKERWLARAAQADSEVRTARLMTEAELQLEGRRFGAAAGALRALQQGGQRHIASLRLMLRAARATGDWDGVLRIVRQLEKHKALSAEQAAPIRQRAHLENIEKRTGDAQALSRYWSAVPAEERADARLAAAAASALRDSGEYAYAQRIVESQLDKAWSGELVELYARCGEGDALERIKRAEAWLEMHPNDARLLLALGRLCRQQQLWGKAQSYLEASLAVCPGRDAHLELARLFEEIGRDDEANRHYRAAADAAQPVALTEAH